MSDAQAPRLHEDTELFRAALNFTERETGFSARLVEKDYFCSVLLADLRDPFEQGLVFKGGTSLSKVHTEFYRLSEDLDFVVSMPIDSPRADRRAAIAPLKAHLSRLSTRLDCFEEGEPLSGTNVSKQYIGRFTYQSFVTGQIESIKVEVGLREPVIEPVENSEAHTLVIHPFRDDPAVQPILVNTLSFRETYAEKFRAALTRREPAIRDYFDIDHAVRIGRLQVGDHQLLALIGKKLAVTGNEPVDVSESKLAVLRRQLAGQLQPVLRAGDFEQFDLERAFRTVQTVANQL